MAYSNIISTQSTFSIDNSHETWTLAAGQMITSIANDGIYEITKYHENTIKVDGSISVGGSGIYALGSETSVIVGAGGSINAHNGIYATGDQFTFVNHGTLTGSGTALYVSGDADHLVNHGAINGMVYAEFADGLSVMLGEDSAVTATGQAIFIDSGAGQTAQIVNRGSIIATGWAFTGGEGNETFINRGILNTDVQLGAGDDVMDNRGGTMQHWIYGDGGNDTFVLDSKTLISELAGGGTDTIKSAISMNLAIDVQGQEIENLTLLGGKNLSGAGNQLDNAIKGNGGNNHLSGGVGDDILTGGQGADIFLFKDGFDHDGIKDFGHGADRIDLSDFSTVTGFADLMAHHVTKSGDDLILHAGTDQLTLEHVAKADLHASDFIF